VADQDAGSVLPLEHSQPATLAVDAHRHHSVAMVECWVRELTPRYDGMHHDGSVNIVFWKKEPIKLIWFRL
jgi:hypothetical protein